MTGPRDGADIAAQSRLEGSGSITDLFLRISDGDQSAWSEIMLRYGGLVSATVRSFRLQEADTLDAIQMTWLQLMTNWRQVQDLDRLGAWLATTARRVCLHILRQAKPAQDLIDAVSETVADRSIDFEQRVFDAATTRMLWDIVAELPPRQRILMEALFTGSPRPYAEVARATGIPPGGIGPARTRALQHLRRKLNEHELGSRARVAEDVEGERTEGDRTGSYFLDDLLDNAEEALRKKLEPAATDLRTGSLQGTADAQLDELLHRADVALRVTLLDHGTSVGGFSTAGANDPDNRIASLPADRRQETTRAQTDVLFDRLRVSERRQLTLVSDYRSAWRVLGPVEMVVAGQVVDLGPPRQRALFGLLLSRVNLLVPVDALIEQLWSGDPPAVAIKSLRVYVSNLRQVLEPGRPARAPATVLRTRPPGYLLDSHGVDFDVHRFIGYATAGREALGRADPQQAVDEFDKALALWRGQPYADVSEARWAAREVARLEELRLSVIEGRCAAQLDMGDHHGAVAELDIYVQAHPLREHGCELLALALYRAGRQAEALAALRDNRKRLAEELGIDPSPALGRLERDILVQAPTLDWQPPRPTPGACVAARAASLSLNRALSARELEVLHLTALALSNAQIGQLLAITDGTVKRHLTNIYAKLGAVSRVDAIRKAIAARLIPSIDS